MYIITSLDIPAFQLHTPYVQCHNENNEDVHTLYTVSCRVYDANFTPREMHILINYNSRSNDMELASVTSVKQNYEVQIILFFLLSLFFSFFFFFFYQ